MISSGFPFITVRLFRWMDPTPPMLVPAFVHSLCVWAMSVLCVSRLLLMAPPAITVFFRHRKKSHECPMVECPTCSADKARNKRELQKLELYAMLSLENYLDYRTERRPYARILESATPHHLATPLRNLRKPYSGGNDKLFTPHPPPKRLPTVKSQGLQPAQGLCILQVIGDTKS